ncbi:MAG: DNA-3-methyladenine glycosylase [Actinomycetota bacterium]|nr:DNA-3-methyladenine glycosylase [Actinomycetota bacterium]
MDRHSGGGRTGSASEMGGEAATLHLRSTDRVLRRLIDGLPPLDEAARRNDRASDPYGSLLRAIVGQQLSVKAGRTIYRRMLDLFAGRVPTPRQLLDADPEAIRAAGLSRPKITYLRDLADRVEHGELALERLGDLPDDDVREQLVAVKGLGRWTADMFLMFHLRRPDVLPVGDLGIRRAVERTYLLEEIPDAPTLQGIAEPWRPHRSTACLYLWHSLDATP